MYAVLFAVLASSVIAAPIAQRGQPESWAAGYLEDYETYHARYLALDCQDQHDSQFFDDCCHPLLSTETLADDRKAYCTPNAQASSSASDYQQTATAAASANNDVESQYQSATSSIASVLATTTPVANAQGDWASPTTTKEKETKTSSSAAAKKTDDSSNHSNSGNSGGNVMTGGFATFFYQNGNAGECGTVHSDSDKVIAIDSNGWWPDYQSNDNSPHCGKWIDITNTNNGKTVTAMVADVCPTCSTDNSLDLSKGAFDAIASESDGMVPITWSFTS